MCRLGGKSSNLSFIYQNIFKECVAKSRLRKTMRKVDDPAEHRDLLHWRSADTLAMFSKTLLSEQIQS